MGRNFKKYPDQWVGFVDVEYELDNDATIKSAVVKFVDKTVEELTLMQIQSNGEINAVYTTLDNVLFIGTMYIKKGYKTVWHNLH